MFWDYQNQVLFQRNKFYLDIGVSQYLWTTKLKKIQVWLNGKWMNYSYNIVCTFKILLMKLEKSINFFSKSVDFLQDLFLKTRQFGWTDMGYQEKCNKCLKSHFSDCLALTKIVLVLYKTTRFLRLASYPHSLIVDQIVNFKSQ